MKNTRFLLVAFSLLALSFSNLYAQDSEDKTPKKEYDLELSKNSIELAKGTSQTVDVNIYRSKSYKKAKASLKISNQIEGVTFAFEPATDVEESSKLTINALDNAKEGTYSILVKSNLASMNKAVILTVQVGNTTNPSTVGSNGGE